MKENVQDIYQLSPPQKGMLFETIYAPESGIHVEQIVCVLHGELNGAAFEQAWQQIVARHSVLRTCFVWEDLDEPLQVVLGQVEMCFERQDWRGLGPNEQEKQLADYLSADRSHSFKLSKAPLMRVALFQMGESIYRLAWTYHHILMDGWCAPLILKEFLAFYRAFHQGEVLRLEASRPYGDYIDWLKQQDLAQAEEFWRNSLRGFAQPTRLGVERRENSYSNQQERYRTERACLPAPTMRALQSLARRCRLTLNTCVQGSWALLLSRYSGEKDLAFGTTVSGRPPELIGIETTIGLFINTLPFRVQLPLETPLLSWLEDVQAQHLALRRYEYCSTGQIHQWSEMPGALPLYESVLVFENYPIDPLVLKSSGLNIEIDDILTTGAQTQYALTLLVSEGHELVVRLIYDVRRLNQSDATMILGHFVALLTAMATNSDRSLEAFLKMIPADQVPQIKRLPELDRSECERGFVAPRTPLEETLAGIWSEILGVEQVGVYDDFFKMGGHSLLATQVVSRVREALQVEIPLRALFKTPNIAGLAQTIKDTLPAGPTEMGKKISLKDIEEGEL
jgi:acyl carrier protein